MMTNVIAFPEPKRRRRAPRSASTGSMTLFLHIRRANLIAHLARRSSITASRGERVIKS